MDVAKLQLVAYQWYPAELFRILLFGSARESLKKIIKNDVYNNFIVIFAFEIVNTFSLKTRDES